MAHQQVLKYKQILNKLATPFLFILIGIVARIIPHAPNFTPIAAIALFGGVYMGRKQAFILPIFAMILSDFIIGFDSIPMRLTVYGSFLIMVLVGLWLKNHNKFGNILAASVFSSLLFFVTTNFMVWTQGLLYAKNLTGLIESYTFAIPFFRNTLLGDLFYSGIFFGGYEFVKNIIKKKSFVLGS